MPEKWERWGKEEIAIMDKHYADTPRNELKQLLPGRTWKAIKGAADRFGFARNRDIPMSDANRAAMHVRLCIARASRTGAPFAGKHHTADAKLAISVSNLHARGHSIADIAQRNRIAEKEVKKMLEERKNG